MSQNLRKNFVISTANAVLSNPESIRKHTWKTQICRYGHNCNSPSDCSCSHFLEEYRIPICLFLEFCQKKDCKMYHPNICAPHDYIMSMGINQILLPKQQWEMKRNTFQGARALIADKDRLRQHFYKTLPCVNGPDCKNKDVCQNAHYADEYRIPMCLFFNFCEEQGCKYFHPLRQTTEEFMALVPKFKYQSQKQHEEAMIERERVMSLLRPLDRPNPLAVPTTTTKAYRAKTKLCEFVKKGICKKNGCTFAHTLEELNIDGLTTVEEKKEFMEKNGNKIPNVFFRPAYKNSIDKKLEYDELKFVIKMRAEENGEEYEDDEDDEEVNEVLDEIDQVNQNEEVIEEHKEEFILELENNQEMDEIDDEIFLETFYFNEENPFVKFRKFRTSEENFCWGDDDSDEYYQGEVL